MDLSLNTRATTRKSVLPCMVLIAAINFLSGCAGTKRTAVNTEKYQVSGLDINGLSYKVFVLPQQPGPNESRHKGSSRNLIFSITVTNTLDNTSPLRKISGDLDQYNTYYEYLLNRCKENLVLKNGNELAYPVYYSFENNYNAFPFETINVGYRLKPLHKNNALTLQFTDLVFAHDTLNFPLNNLKY